MRQAFIQSLIRLAESNPKIYLLTGDLGYRVLEPFIEKFPNRFLNVGVAEANLITVSAGLASMGFIPFAYSIATFATLRPYEQIRNDVCLQNLGVKIVGVGGGLAYAKAGPSHHSVEDIALMRTLPNMTIIAPNQPSQIDQVLTQITNTQGPCYLRLERNPREDIKEVSAKKFKVGKGIQIKAGAKIAILATGNKIETALNVSRIFEKKGTSIAVFTFPTVQPLDLKLLLEIGREYSYIVTLEEHSILGGFGSSVLEFFASTKLQTRILNLGLKKTFTPISSDYNELIKLHKLSPEQVANSISKFFLTA